MHTKKCAKMCNIVQKNSCKPKKLALTASPVSPPFCIYDYCGQFTTVELDHDWMMKMRKLVRKRPVYFQAKVW